MQIKTIFLLIFFVISVHASDKCKVDDLIMYNIASIEAHKDLPVGYPYIISLNNKKDFYKLKNDDLLKDLFLDKRTIHCLSQNVCVLTLKYLIAKNIKNVDCGAFQLNYKFWKIPKKDYFDVEKSYRKACDIVMFYNKKEWTWENIAKYHSKTKVYNTRYKNNLLAKLEGTINQK